MDWAIKSHFEVEHISLNQIKYGLLGCKMSVEKTKEGVAGYFKVHTKYPEIFQRLMPGSEEYNKCKKLTTTIVMPKLTQDLCRITIFIPDDPNGEATDGITYEVLPLMQAEIRIRSVDFFVSNYLIIDLKHFHFGFISKFSPSIVYKLMDILLSTTSRIKNVHLVNVPPLIEQVKMLLKPIIPKKLFERIRTHENFESLQECIPKEYLPLDFGGTEPSISEIEKRWYEKIESQEKIFRELLNCKSTIQDWTDKHIGELSMEGSFRKLTID
ncbi:alpha-tocopherol transfer protein-like [Leptinotarsa decemlineata]|uniref:alpha-tocopherol transfer protein-like n=1 Tax=Leptinotarsa decemlineata TaxID=7539 RepID=UPI000C2526E9|nr:uncharacterized protein LOC111501841 [Leptinotarsa decemlineata]